MSEFGNQNYEPEVFSSATNPLVIDLLLISIALEEIGLSHVINAEGEKIQAVLQGDTLSVSDAVQINKSVENTLKTVIKTQMLLQFKLENVMDLAGIT